MERHRQSMGSASKSGGADGAMRRRVLPPWIGVLVVSATLGMATTSALADGPSGAWDRPPDDNLVAQANDALGTVSLEHSTGEASVWADVTGASAPDRCAVHGWACLGSTELVIGTATLGAGSPDLPAPQRQDGLGPSLVVGLLVPVIGWMGLLLALRRTTGAAVALKARRQARPWALRCCHR